MNIDWSKAPEGANYRDAGGNWLRFKNNQWFLWSSASGGYWFTIGKHNLQKPLTQRDAHMKLANLWIGEGLPPVGTVCEAWHSGSHQGEVTVLFIGKQTAVLRNHSHGDEQHGALASYKFRPIRTPEQVAADERENAITDMCVLLGKDPERIGARENSGILYDAGYRKQEVS